MTLSVSVALCTHNGAAFVEDQVRSILLQTAAPIAGLAGGAVDPQAALAAATPAGGCVRS